MGHTMCAREWKSWESYERCENTRNTRHKKKHKAGLEGREDQSIQERNRFLFLILVDDSFCWRRKGDVMGKYEKWW